MQHNLAGGAVLATAIALVSMTGSSTSKPRDMRRS
jgi:hypothetical protein